MVVSKLGVVEGDSLADDIEGGGEELVLRRACAPGGGLPKERVEIIRSGGEWFNSRYLTRKTLATSGREK